MYKTIDIYGNSTDYVSKFKIKRCMLDLISLSRQFDCNGENTLGQRLKTDIGKTSLQKEYRTIKIRTARKQGCTTACLEIVSEDPKSCYVARTSLLAQRLKKSCKEFKDQIYHLHEFINDGDVYNDVITDKGYELIFVDDASYIKYEEELIETCDHLKNCILVLVG